MSVKMVSRFFAAALVALSMTAPLAIAQETQKPNIVLMVMDNLGWGEIGVYGGVFFGVPKRHVLIASLPRACAFSTSTWKHSAPPVGPRS